MIATQQKNTTRAAWGQAGCALSKFSVVPVLVQHTCRHQIWHPLPTDPPLPRRDDTRRVFLPAAGRLRREKIVWA